MKRLSLLLFSLLLTTVALAGPREVIMLVDRDSGVALVAEGTPIPEGVLVYGNDGSVLRFETAPESRFAEARAAIARTRPALSATPFVVRDKAEPGPGRLARPNGFEVRTNVDESDTTYYVYFYDGSYIWANRRIYNVLPNQWHYAVQTGGYTPENDYYDGWVYVEQSSTDHPGYNTTAYCSIGSSGGSCQTYVIAYQAGSDFSAHVTSSGNIHHHRLPICGRYGEPPCQENLSGSIEIYFP